MKTVEQIIKENGLLKGLHLKIYLLMGDSELTIGEIYRKFQSKYKNTRQSRDSLSKRVPEMVARDALVITGQKVCSYSGKKVNCYKVSGRIPTPAPQKMSLVGGKGQPSAPENLNYTFMLQNNSERVLNSEYPSFYFMKSLLLSKTVRFMSLFMGKKFRLQLAVAKRALSLYLEENEGSHFNILDSKEDKAI